MKIQFKRKFFVYFINLIIGEKNAFLFCIYMYNYWYMCYNKL